MLGFFFFLFLLRGGMTRRRLEAFLFVFFNAKLSLLHSFPVVCLMRCLVLVAMASRLRYIESSSWETRVHLHAGGGGALVPGGDLNSERARGRRISGSASGRVCRRRGDEGLCFWRRPTSSR